MNKITISTKKPMVVGADICDRPIREGDYLLCVDSPSTSFPVKDGRIYRAGVGVGAGTIAVRTAGNRRQIPGAYFFGRRFVTLGQ